MASVVITNPTHFAVALKYERGMNAPVCVAKGVDLIARKIREVAREHDIPVVENPPVARALHGTVEVDRDHAAASRHGVVAVKHDAKPLASGDRPGHHFSSRPRCGEDESVRFRGKMEPG